MRVSRYRKDTAHLTGGKVKVKVKGKAIPVTGREGP
jgi:hypothetical protein